jgi:hypothetical protein
MKAILQKDILDDEDYIIRQKGDEIEVEKLTINGRTVYWWEYCPGRTWYLDESEVAVNAT